MPPTPQRDLSAPTIVIGAGPHGLAAAALLNRSGEPTVILERSDRVGASWAQRYDHLRLHTTPSTSKLPGLSVPRQAGPWVSRDDYVRYLERYVAHHRLDVRVTTPVDRIERAEPGSGALWLVHTPDGPVPAGAVVVATGRCHTPNLPAGPGVRPSPAPCCTRPTTALRPPTAGGTSWSSAPVTAAPRSRASWPGPEPGGYGSQSVPHPTSCPAPAHDGMRPAD